MTEEAAALALQDVEMRVEGKAPRPDEVASTDALGRFLAFLRVRGRREDTVAYYQRILTETFDAMSGTPMRLWHRGLFEVYIASHAKAWSPRTIQTRVNASRAFIGWAKASSLNVGDYVAGFRGPEVRAKERPHYTADELRRLIDEAGQPGHPAWLEVAVGLAAMAGASMGDLYTLTWAEVDLDGGWIRSRRSKTGQPWVVKMPASLRAILLRHRAVGGPVVRDIPKHDASVSHTLARLCEKVGLPSVGGLKRLRHSYCTLLGVGRDVDLATGRAAMGHAPGSNATLRYMHTTSDGLANAASVVEGKIRAS